MMQPPFPFETVVAFGFLSVMLLIGIVIRARVSFIQRLLFPSCLLGGLVGMVALNTGFLPVKFSDIESLAYHFFNISFISVGLMGKAEEENISGKEKLKGPLWLALVQSLTFPLQAIIGGVVVLACNAAGMGLFKTFGFFAPLGFNEGPGQALSFGKVWEGMGFEHATTIGLTFASLGFFFAFFLGVPLANWGIRKGLAKYATRELPRPLLVGILNREGPKESAGELTFHSSNVDTLAFQAALVGMSYLFTYSVTKFLGSFVPPDIAKVLWGFCFIFGLGVSILIRVVLDKLGVGYLLNQGVQRRITGWSVDFLLVATVAGIQMAIIWKFIVPISIISLACGLLTAVVIVFLGRRLSSYNLERILAIYGTTTGTVSTGLLLLRIADPEFKTPVAVELAVMNIFAIPIISLCLVLVNAPVMWGWSIGLSVLLFFVFSIVGLILIRLFGLWGKPKF